MIKPQNPLTLEGKRVRLIPLQQSHTDALFEAGNDPAIWQGFIEPITKLADAQHYVSSALEEQSQNGSMPFSIYDKESAKIVGSTRLFDISPAHRQLEIGHTWNHPAVWRTRVNTECKYLLLVHCFETLGMIRVQIKTDLRNTRSQAAIARLGAVKEGVLRRHRVLYDGYIRDTVIYSIIDLDWPNVKSQLEYFLNQK
jgi:RimJ/RimL family protein N-acetyltransferase